jgi:hypothetical protein
MAESQYPLGPYRLITVNNAPERAKKLIGRMVEEVKDKYTIIHAGNVDSKFFAQISTGWEVKSTTIPT